MDTNNPEADIGAVADMVAGDLGLSYRKGDEIEGKLILRQVKEVLSTLEIDNSHSTSVLRAMETSGYLSRKGIIYIFQSPTP